MQIEGWSSERPAGEARERRQDLTLPIALSLDLWSYPGTVLKLGGDSFTH